MRHGLNIGGRASAVEDAVDRAARRLVVRQHAITVGSRLSPTRAMFAVCDLAYVSALLIMHLQCRGWNRHGSRSIKVGTACRA